MIFIIVLLLLLIYFKYQNLKNKEQFYTHDMNYGTHIEYLNIYDDFYSYLYDKIYFNKDYYNKFANIVLQYSNPVYNNNLFIGMKTGGHINELLKKNIQTKSISKSESIIKICKNNYPNNNYLLNKDYDTNPYTFSENEFTHISIIDNELYYLNDIRSILYNCNKWIIHKGYLFIQVYNDLNSLKNNFFVVNDNIYNYNYEYNIKKTNHNNLRIIETIYNKKNKRTNHHVITYHDLKYIKYTAKEFDFKHIEDININDNESILVFQKL